MEELRFEEILALYEALRERGAIPTSSLGEILLSFKTVEDRSAIENLCVSLSIPSEDLTSTSFSIPNRYLNTLFFEDIDHMLDYITLTPKVDEEARFFVFNFNDHYLYYNWRNKETKTNSSDIAAKAIIDHFVQYTRLLRLYLSSKGKLYEIERSRHDSNELVIFSKGEERSITEITYRKIEKAGFTNDYYPLNIEVFEAKILSDEWLACFNNTVCQYMELQASPRRTFVSLYNNFTFLFNQAERNFNLYISKFSFDKIRKQFNEGKNNYFEGLNTAQEKISSQIIAIPISLGMSVLSFYQFSESALIQYLIYTSIAIYSIFIGYLVVINLYDLKKIAGDIGEDRENLLRYYPDLFEIFKSDFQFMKNKRYRIAFLAWSILAALVITLAMITIFLLNRQAVTDPSFHFV